MDYIIITLIGWNNSWSYDIEVPRNVLFEKLRRDIVEAINFINPCLLSENCTLYFNRLGRYLNPDESLLSAGVWNGDIVSVK